MSKETAYYESFLAEILKVGHQKKMRGAAGDKPTKLFSEFCQAAARACAAAATLLQ